MSKFSLKKAKEEAVIVNKAIEMKILSDPEAYALYERKRHEIELALLMRETREKEQLSQEEMAERMQTTKSAVSRLESYGASRHSPSFDTLLKYAKALGYKLTIKLVPLKQLNFKR